MKYSKTSALLCFSLIWLSLILFLFPPPMLHASLPSEDFTTYIEYDPNNHITVSTNEIEHVSWRNEDAWVYKDFTEAHFENFTHKVDIKSNLAWGYGAVWQLSNDIQDVLWLRQNDKTFLNVGIYEWSAPTEPRLIFEETYLGDTYQQQWFGIQANTWYYLVIQKAGVNFTCKVFSDSARTNLLTTLNLTLQANHKFKYLFGCCTLDSGNANAITNNIKNLHIGEYPIVTFYYSIGGLFRVDNVSVSNGTSEEYSNLTVLEFSALPENSTFVFSMFEWNTQNVTVNPFNFTVSGSMTVWCYFSAAAGNPLPGVIIGLLILIPVCLVILLILRKR